LCLTPTGSGALGPVGILAALFFIFRDALREWFHGMGRNRGVFIHRRQSKEILFEWIYLYRASFIAGCGALVLYGILCFFGGIPLPSALVLVPAYASVLVLSRWAESKWEGNAFFPLPIRPLSGLDAFFIPVVPVFTLLFVLALGLTLAAEPAGPDHPPGVLPGPEEYAAHAAFQGAFSVRSLHSGGTYGSYSTGPDGLIADFTEFIPPDPAIPPYPLNPLNPLNPLAMLGGADTNRQDPPFGSGVLISLGLMVLLSVPPLVQTLRDSKKNKILV
jgi:hypothetical protein